ncbi:mCG146840 [Mus musculus]|nr:mCG146840 [Mus musculus]
MSAVIMFQCSLGSKDYHSVHPFTEEARGREVMRTICAKKQS